MTNHTALRNIAKRTGRTVEDVTEQFEERAAIREYDGGMSRDAAERAALYDVGGKQ